MAQELGLRFGASPPHSHHSNRAVERLHRTLLDQLRAVRTLTVVTQLRDTTRSTTTTSTTMVATTQCLHPQQQYLVKDTGTIAHQNNDHKPYNNPMCQFGEAVLADTRYLVNYKLKQRNLDQKIKGLWVGKDPTFDEHLIALPPVYDNHLSVTGAEESLANGHLWRAWTTLNQTSLRTTSTYKSTTQAQENNLHNNHNSYNQCKNNHNKEHNEEKFHNQSNHRNHLAPQQKLFHHDHHQV